MKRRSLTSCGALVAAVGALSIATVIAQAPNAKPKPAAQSRAFTAPRTADGQPDLQGVWANNGATPLERPKELEGKQFLSDQELAALKDSAASLFNGAGDAAFGDEVYKAALAKMLAQAKGFKSSDTKTGNYNHFWIVDRDFDNRTSLITEPSDGKLPPVTAEAKKIADAAAYRRAQDIADGPEDLPLTHRCITFGAPRIDAGYNSYFQIFQSKDYVAIGMETIHDARIIPLDGRPHLASNVKQWLGDSRGHFDGDTLVVDTTNYLAGASPFRGNSDQLHVTERFTRVGPKTIKYEVHYDDPGTWTKPWTAVLYLSHSNEQIFEYACHEGNEGMEGALSGHRAQEKAAAARKSQQSK